MVDERWAVPATAVVELRRGGGGGAPAPAPPGGPLPSLWQITKSVNQCAASYANQHSLASDLGWGNSRAANIFLGNDAATLSNIAFGPNRAGSAVSWLFSNPSNANLIGPTARGISALPNPFANPTYTVTVGGASASTETFDVTAISLDVSKTVPTVGESLLGKTIGGFFNALTWIKAPFDVGVYVNGLAACSGFPHF